MLKKGNACRGIQYVGPRRPISAFRNSTGAVSPKKAYVRLIDTKYACAVARRERCNVRVPPGTSKSPVLPLGKNTINPYRTYAPV